MGLTALALPKVCCVFWLAMASAPAIAASVRLTGLRGTAEQIDQLCRTGAPWLPGALNLPTLWAFALLFTGFLLLAVRFARGLGRIAP